MDNLNGFQLIAHRGACLERQECTLDALKLASELGADAVECDPRYTADGKLVIFHDDTLRRLADNPAKMSDLTLDEARTALASKGLVLNTLDEILEGYPADGAPVLFDFSLFAIEPDFYKKLLTAPFKVICGIHDPAEGVVAREFFPEEQILAFMPSPDRLDEFAPTCGILRLWEHWLDRIMPLQVKERYPDKQVWIMAKNPEIHHPLFSMNGSPESIARAKIFGADGMLLNDIRMAVSER